MIIGRREILLFVTEREHVSKENEMLRFCTFYQVNVLLFCKENKKVFIPLSLRHFGLKRLLNEKKMVNQHHTKKGPYKKTPDTFLFSNVFVFFYWINDFKR